MRVFFVHSHHVFLRSNCNGFILNAKTCVAYRIFHIHSMYIYRTISNPKKMSRFKQPRLYTDETGYTDYDKYEEAEYEYERAMEGEFEADREDPTDDREEESDEENS